MKSLIKLNFIILICSSFLLFVTCEKIQEDATTDSDNDGINDLADNCDDVFNPDQADWDDDYIGDACDENITPCGDPQDQDSGNGYNSCDPSITDTGDNSWCDLDDVDDAYNDTDNDGDADYICHGRVTHSNGKKTRYYRNFPLSLATYQHQTVAIKDDPKAINRYAINKALIIIHGLGQTAYSYYRNARQAAIDAGCFKNTIILTPHFISEKHNPKSDEFYWKPSSPSWNGGANSLNAPATSAYSVLDEIIEKCTHFPNIEEIVIFGHSAGGQFVQRYAATSLQENNTSIPIKYIVGNPSSYMYLNNKRPLNHKNGHYIFSVPPPTTCLYNKYKYGTDLMYSYMPTKNTIRSQYPPRNVIYMIGELENDCACVEQGNGDWDGEGSCGDDLACSCEARFQGLNRYERAYAFLDFMDAEYPNHNHSLVEVPGVGHSSSGLMGSAEGQKLIFDID